MKEHPPSRRYTKRFNAEHFRLQAKQHRTINFTQNPQPEYKFLNYSSYSKNCRTSNAYITPNYLQNIIINQSAFYLISTP